MKPPSDWAWEFLNICADTPCVHGQMLPQPQVERFVRRIQKDALRWASDQIVKDGNPAIAQDKIDTQINALTI